jgi:arylsulfatase A-like enzyme
MYYRKPPPLPRNFRPLPAIDNGFTKNVRDENLAPYPRPETVIRDQLCEYYGLITHLDGQVGRILEALDKAGFGKNTLIIYAADHGLALGSHGLLGKQSVYEHSMKSPLIIAGPGVPSGKSTEAFTYLLDLFPTVCAATGAPLPDRLAGFNLAPLWTGKQKAVRDSIFLPYTTHMRAVRDRRWKLIVYPQINHWELFDLRKDPDELRNLAEEKPAEVERLTRLLHEWQERAGDEQSLSVTNPKPKTVRFDDFDRKPDQWQPRWIVEKYF